ncbi:NAD-glutamate dehydrogenase domain-containing protein [Mariprofundus ferrooxydans]|uniref:NAD-glutamate dehydrogenase domain-containing protein n=1 Tax=Mariprofundus ferrooxydans TaxID=314344 RepID=UPI001430574F|nr:NAD-glutamate dehydrogenase domain-containing protein [Mariprofundus ferrooxydans]
MRHLRRQLIDLLDQARLQHAMGRVQPRLVAALVQDFYALLPKGKTKRIAMGARTLTHGDLHRHIFTIRCPDQAFYLDAIKGYLLRLGIQPIGQQTMVARMPCGPDGCALELYKPDIHDEDNFMFIAIHISATLTPDAEPLRLDIKAILKAVDLSEQDFSDMRMHVGHHVARLMPENPDAAAMLDWINDNHYLYFGITQHDKRLGLLCNKNVLARVMPGLPDEVEACGAAEEPGLEWLNLAACQHYLYSAASVEVVRICWTDPGGQLEEALIIGHFSRSARFANASYLPMLAARWRALSTDPLLQHSAFYRREVRTLFDRMPKRILLATRPEDWLEPLKGIIDLADPLQLVVNTLPSVRGNLDTLLVAIAAKRFGPVVMQRVMDSLADAGIPVHGYDSFGIGPHRIILISIARERAEIAPAKLSALIRRCIIFWKDLAKAEVLRHAATLNIPDTLQELESVPSLYQDLFPPVQYTRDVKMRQHLLANGRTCVHVSQKASVGEIAQLHIYSLEQPSLGQLVDILRLFALDPIQESLVPFGLSPDGSGDPGRGRIYISALTCRAPHHLDHGDIQRLQRGLTLVLNGEADHDAVNGLMIAAALDIDELAILITLRNHLVQLLPDAARLPLTDMMLRHAKVSACLQRLFAARHLSGMPDSVLAEARNAFDHAMQSVGSLTDDRWFRALAELVEAGVRTNAFVRSRGAPIGIKIDTAQLGFALHPLPWREIFVHGVHVEGAHLRAGPIARGGIRYSDRPADFRTEILELMSTQTIKNGQIVPTGSKGGFVIRGGQGPAFVLQQYRSFIRTLLALTDNLVDGALRPPEGIRIPEVDANDAYLVVAADKGTASFSNDANDESQANGFWLDDAFASGGRFGYDHKVVGITARGAWICATHLFAKLGVDACADPISCVGIGDMGGDVFGNGMLLNPAMRLVAAFNHRHIFLDPEPDAAKAFAERRRLFAAGSGWDGYHTSVISRGGGVFERSAKQIKLSAHVRMVLGIEAAELDGEALIRAILSAPVDLLYNGGIGTYVKSTTEAHAEARDPANNAVRVNAAELRCKVVCEGGNLGFTQKARIEYARAGGLINTDAMDNSAGVDMSDHEVNLKILFNVPTVRAPLARRNSLLVKLTDAVTEQCLMDNLLQSRALTLAEFDAGHYPPRMQRLRDGLANQGWLDASVAPQIDDNELLHLRPQLSILLGQEKNRIHARLSGTDFDTSSVFSQQLLQDYFPPALKRKYASAYSAHPLASEIINTQVTNHVVNHMGLCTIHHMETLVDASTADIVEALLIAEVLLDTESLRTAIWDDIADMNLAVALQHALQASQMLFAENLLRLCPVEQLDQAWIATQQRGLRRFRKKMAADVDPDEALIASGLAEEHCRHLAIMPLLAQSACAVHLASSMHISLNRCLSASRACLALLPIDEMERSLRSPEWADDDAHNLRREWLHRLTLLQNRAIAQLLSKPGHDFDSLAATLWQQHPYWSDIESLEPQINDPTASPESRRMRLMLGLTRLEAIVDHHH